MEETKKEVSELNELIFNPELSIEELEERLEFDTWGVCGTVLCETKCGSPWA